MTLPILISLSALFGYLHPLCITNVQGGTEELIDITSIKQNQFNGVIQFEYQAAEYFIDYNGNYTIEYSYGFDFYNDENEFEYLFAGGICSSTLVDGTSEDTWRIVYSYNLTDDWSASCPLLQYPNNNWSISVLICQYSTILDILTIDYTGGFSSFSFSTSQFSATHNNALTRLVNSQIYPVLMLSTNPNINDFYINGYNDRNSEIGGINLGNYLFAIADVPFYTMRQFFSDSLFGGPSLYLILMSLVTFALVIGLIKRFWK